MDNKTIIEVVLTLATVGIVTVWTIVGKLVRAKIASEQLAYQRIEQALYEQRRADLFNAAILDRSHN